MKSALSVEGVRGLARAIRMLDDDPVRGRELIREVYPRTGRAWVIGVTGPAGVGKSTLINQLIRRFRDRKRKVGVIAVDPTSPYSGGAILGDRIRMQDHESDPGVFMRSLATRGRMGGLSRSTFDIIDLLDAYGMDVIMVETVGVGQDEVDIARVAHTTVLTLVPGLGDDVQALKAGIMEIADIFVINKRDRPGAERMKQELEAILALGDFQDRRRPPIVLVQANQGLGVEELEQVLEEHYRDLERSGRLAAHRREYAHLRFYEAVRSLIMRQLDRDAGGEQVGKYVRAVAEARLDPYTAAMQYLQDSAGWFGTRETRPEDS